MGEAEAAAAEEAAATAAVAAAASEMLLGDARAGFEGGRRKGRKKE